MKRILIGLIVVVIPFFCLRALLSSKNITSVNTAKLAAAANSYSAELKAKGAAVPQSVTLKELISLKLLNQSDVTGFDGAEVTISLYADKRNQVDVLMRAKYPDGREIVLLEDGSVRGVTKQQ
jgi:hypothetical protein